MLGGGRFGVFNGAFLILLGFCCLCSCRCSQLIALAPVFCSVFLFCAYNNFVLLCLRRIDVSPRAFKKHSQLFEAVKNSEDGTYKVTEHFAEWSILEKQTANEWARCLLDCTLLKLVAFLEERCTKSKKCKIRHFERVCYISPSHMVSLWAQAWARLMNLVSSEKGSHCAKEL